MISFAGNPGDRNCKILFSARPAFRDDPKVTAFDRELVYGHRCPTCGNVIQAMFRTEKAVSLWKYEETAYVSSSDSKFGEVLRYLPGPDSKDGYSQYDVTTHRVGKNLYQHLLLRNHVLQYEGLNKPYKQANRHGLSGGYPCPYVCLISRRPELIMQDIFLFLGEDIPNMVTMISEKTLPTFDEFVSFPALIAHGFRAIPAYGDAPAALSFPSRFVTSNYNMAYVVNGPRNSILTQRKEQLT